LLAANAQRVSGLDLEVRGAGAQRLIAQALRVGAELVFARLAGRLDRRLDPSCRVGLSAHPRVELGGSVACEHEVCVAVDEPRQRGRTGRVDQRPLDALGNAVTLAHPDDPVAVDRDRGVVDDAERPAPGSIVRDELADMVDEHYESAIGIRTPRSVATAFASS
jgi:hypothetical protein